MKMGLNWYPVLGCLCLMVTTVFSAAVTTPDSMVVSRSDGDDVSSPSAPSEPTTEEPQPPIKLTEMDVTSNIAMRYAHTAIVARMHNPANRAQEATFRVLLPETAFISSFTMIIDGKSYKAYVKEKEEAKQIYTQAVSQGIGAAHVATKARDSNQFMVSTNIEPHDHVIFNLTYEEALARRNSLYNHDINMHLGQPVPKLTVTVNIRESQNITLLRVPEVRTGNEIDASPDDPQNQIANIERGPNGAHATITFKPDLAEQQRLMDIYLEKTKETNVSPPRYYGYDDMEDNSNDREGVLGQFVVQYDVDRPKNGEILVNDGYFVHFYAPSDLPPLSKLVMLVLDTSGSMMDRKIEQLRDSMSTILGDLNEGDFFSIIEFASSVKVHDLKEADREPVSPYTNYGYSPYSDYNTPVTLVPPYKATPKNIAKAKVIVSRLQASGGTNIYSALDVALDLVKRGVGWKVDAAGTTSPQPLPSAAPATSETTVAEPVSEDPKKVVPELEPMIIFLTDGDPTVGQTDPVRIVNHLSEKNSGMNKATIFCLAFGEDADRKFLRKLALRNDGFMRHIYEASDAAAQLHDFYRQIASPLLADVKFTYPKKQVKADTLTKNRFRRYYLGSETVVAGQIAEGVTELTPTVGAFCGTDDLYRRKYMELQPRVPVPMAREKFLPLERMWAYITVKQLLDERDARAASGDADDDEESPDKRALDIALKYSFVTPLTSLVVVKPNETSAVNAESVDKQNNGGLYGAGVPLSGSYAGLSARPAGPQLASFALGPPPSAPASYFAPGFPGPPSTYLPTSNTGFGGALAAPAPAFDLVSDPFVAEDAQVEEEDPLPVEDSLATYHLQDYAWLSSLLVGDRIVFPSNATSPDAGLKLSTDTVAPRAAGGQDASCAAAAGGGAGVCVYLTRCASTTTLTADSYPSVHCSVDGYAGVCCLKDKVDVKSN